MGYAYEGEIYVPTEDLVEFLTQYIPDDKTGDCEVLFNLAGMEWEDGSELVVQFAANTNCRPEDQAVPPSWMLKEAKDG